MPTIGSRLKELRKRRGFGQENITKLLKKDRAVGSHYERDIAIPPGDVEGRVANILSVTTNFILGRSELDVADDKIRA